MKTYGRLLALIALCELAGCGERDCSPAPERSSKAQVQPSPSPEGGKQDGDGEAVCAACDACGQEEIIPREQAPMSARELVEGRLAAKKVRLGYNGETLTAVLVGEGRLRIDETAKGFWPADGEVKYDFAFDKDDDGCIRRSKAYWRAYADCLAEISIGTSENVRATNCVAETDGNMYFDGLGVLMSAELVDGDSYSVAIAVSWQPRRNGAATVSAGKKGLGLAARVEDLNRESAFGIRHFVDGDGVRWRVGIVCAEEPDPEHAGVMPFRLAKAKRLAYEFALRSDKVDVTVRQKCQTKEAGHGDDEFEGTITVNPVATVASNDAENVKWFIFSGVDQLTQRKVRRCFCAIREPLLDSVDRHDNQIR